MTILFQKMLAGFIDIFASLFIRLIILSLIISFYREDLLLVIEDLLVKTENIEKLGDAIKIFLRHEAFKILLIFIIIFALLGSFYYVYFHSSSWCATIGQRICGIVMVQENGQYLTLTRAIIHHIVSTIPLFITIYFIIFIVINNHKYITNNIGDFLNIFNANYFNILISIIMFLWINIPIFLKSKKSVPDIICNTKIESGRADSIFPKIRI
jgi:uncharacterized RDD family membrane protein YckC